MRSSIVVALVVSLLVHGLLALALVAYLEYAPGPDVLATLDLSSVELSLAEKVEESAAATPMPATPPARPREQPKTVEPPAPVPEKIRPLPPDPSSPKFREPKEAPRKFEPEDAESVPDREQSNNPDSPNNRTISPTLPAPRQARIDAPPRPRRSIRPEYPKGARQRGEQGDVTLEIRVGAGGEVEEAKVVVTSGFAELDAAAVKAAKAAKFTPAKSGRDAVASMARLKLSFKLK